MTRPSDEADFDAFYRATAPRVVRLVHASTGDLGLAQDCTQEAFARAWADWARVSGADDPLAWVRTVARRLAISDWRRGRTRREAHRRVASREEGPTGTAEHVDVVAALRTLPPDVREAVVLYYVGDLSVEAVAARTGARPGTVKARLHRGRSRLAPLLSLDADPSTADPDGGPR